MLWVFNDPNDEVGLNKVLSWILFIYDDLTCTGEVSSYRWIEVFNLFTVVDFLMEALLPSAVLILSVDFLSDPQSTFSSSSVPFVYSRVNY